MRSDTTLGRILLGVLYIGIVSAIILATMYSISIKNNEKSTVVLAGQEIFVLIADTPTLQERGLSGKKVLQEKEGMLFVFPKPVHTGFWMKDMSFPIDIIWFDADRKIVDVWENASPSSYPEVRYPQQDAKYVLEVPSGYFKKYNLKKGDVLELEASAGYTN